MLFFCGLKLGVYDVLPKGDSYFGNFFELWYFIALKIGLLREGLFLNGDKGVIDWNPVCFLLS